MNLLWLHISKLLPAVDIEYENRFRYYDSDEHGSPEQKGKLVRKFWELPSGPVRNLIAEIENAGGIV